MQSFASGFFHNSVFTIPCYNYTSSPDISFYRWVVVLSHRHSFCLPFISEHLDVSTSGYYESWCYVQVPVWVYVLSSSGDTTRRRTCRPHGMTGTFRDITEVVFKMAALAVSLAFTIICLPLFFFFLICFLTTGSLLLGLSAYTITPPFPVTLFFIFILFFSLIEMRQQRGRAGDDTCSTAICQASWGPGA